MNVSLQKLGLSVDYDELRLAIEWKKRSVRVFGKTYPQPRLTCWYGNVPYVYSGLAWEPKPMPLLIARVKDRVEALTGERFNSCLCNLYRDGKDSVGWHADDEPIFGGDPVVASVSFGFPRMFQIRPNKGTLKDGQSFLLEDGHLLVMGKGVQPHFKHCVPKSIGPVGERINLTYRRTL